LLARAQEILARKPPGRRGIGIVVKFRGERRFRAVCELLRRHRVIGSAHQPFGISRQSPSRRHLRPHMHDQLESAICDQMQQPAQIAARIRVAVEVELSFSRLVPIPRDREVDRVDAQFVVAVERMRPQILRHAEVIERGAVHEKRFAIHLQFGPRVVLNDASAR
jgi:hypothetical protein